MIKLRIYILPLFLIILSHYVLYSFELSGVADPPFSDFQNSFWMETVNDSTGLTFDNEWDDYRTFGINTGLIFKDKFIFSAGTDYFTDRSDSVEDSRRLDLLSLSFAYKFLEINNYKSKKYFIYGAGSRYYGRLYGYEIQHNFHKYVEQEREIPSTYFAYSFNDPFFYLKYSFYKDTYVNFSFKSSALFLLSGNSEYNTELLFLDNSDYHEIYAGFAYIYKTNDKSHEILYNVNKAEKGPWFKSGAYMNIFYIESALNTFSMTSLETIGIRLGENNFYETGNSKNLFLEISHGIGYPLYSRSLSWKPYSFDNAKIFDNSRLYLNFDTGWAGETLFPDYGIRLHLVTAGISYSPVALHNQFHVYPYIFSGFGIRTDRRFERVTERSESEQASSAFIYQNGLGLRFLWKDFFTANKKTYSGICLSYRYDAAQNINSRILSNTGKYSISSLSMFSISFFTGFGN